VPVTPSNLSIVIRRNLGGDRHFFIKDVKLLLLFSMHNKKVGDLNLERFLFRLNQELFDLNAMEMDAALTSFF
jgi:hypothetical protein